MKTNLLFTILLALASFSLCSCNDDDDEYEGKSSTLINRENKEAGEKFLEDNKSADGVKETYTGLQYSVIEEGKGEQPELKDSVIISFKGQLIDNTVFCDVDSFKALVSDESEGMQEGLRLMSEGSEYKLFVPYYLAFGSNSRSFFYNNRNVSVGPYSAILYTVKLHKVIKR